MTDSFDKFAEEVEKRNEFIFLDRTTKTKSVIQKYGLVNFYIPSDDPYYDVLKYITDNSGYDTGTDEKRYPIRSGGHGNCLELDENGDLISFRPLAVVPPEWVMWVRQRINSERIVENGSSSQS